MAVIHAEIPLDTRGDHHVADITPAVQDAVRKSGCTDGTVTVFCPGSTGGVTTIEFEDGALRDLEELFDQIVPAAGHYHHNARWGDGNGHSHVRSALMGPSLVVPFAAGKLVLGTWQQVIFIDFDNRARSRRLVATVMGE